MAITFPSAAFTIPHSDALYTEHPPGEPLAKRLREILGASEPDVWRDSGWSLEAEVEGVRFEVFFAAPEEPHPEAHWLLGIAPLGTPSLLDRLRGRKPTPYLSQMKTVAATVHQWLEHEVGAVHIRWALNKDPRTDPPVSQLGDLPWPEVEG